MLSWLAYSETIGIPTANPAYLDLAVVRVAFGLRWGFPLPRSAALSCRCSAIAGH